MKLIISILLLIAVATTGFALRPIPRVNPALRAPALQLSEATSTSESPAQTPLPVGPIAATDEINSIWQVGSTYADFFSYGSHNRFIERDTMGGLHISWMNYRIPNNANDRIVSYTFREPWGGAWWGTNSSVFSLGAGFNQQECLRDGRAVVLAHEPIHSGYRSVIGIDEDYQICGFRREIVPNPISLPLDTFEFPSGTVDRRNRVHIFSRDLDGGRNIPYYRVFYSRTDSNQTNPQNFSYAFRSFQPSYAVATSRISNKVAVAWAQTVIPNGYTTPGGWNGTLAQSYNNDLWVAQSTDGGTTWNFDDPRNNITQFRNWSWQRFNASGNRDILGAAGDTLRFVNIAAMVYDNYDHLHVIFNVCQLFEDYTIDTAGQHTPPVGRIGYSPTLLYHWTDASPYNYSVVADGWWYPAPVDDRTSPRWLQQYRTTIDRFSLSIATNNELYCVFTRYGNPRNPIDTSANGYPCGNVWVTHSVDNGLSWFYPTPVSDTTNNAGATSGFANSYIWPSMPEVVDNDSLYIMYFDDRSGGSAMIDGMDSGSVLRTDWTQNRVYVQTFSRDRVRSDSTLRYPTFPPLHVSYRNPQMQLVIPNTRGYVGNPARIQWTVQNVDTAAMVEIQFNRNYPYGDWEPIGFAPVSAGGFNWTFDRDVNLKRLKFKISLGEFPEIFSILANDIIPRDSSLIMLRLLTNSDACLQNPITLKWDWYDYSHLMIFDTSHIRVDLNRDFPVGNWSTVSVVPIHRDSLVWYRDSLLTTSTARIRISILNNVELYDLSPVNLRLVSDVKEPHTQLLTSYRLSPASPNPFNPYTTIRFAIPFRERVTVKAYDIAGREIATLADNIYNAGEQRITWRPYRLSSGVYFVKMTAGRYSATQKVVFMK